MVHLTTQYQNPLFGSEDARGVQILKKSVGDFCHWSQLEIYWQMLLAGFNVKRNFDTGRWRQVCHARAANFAPRLARFSTGSSWFVKKRKQFYPLCLKLQACANDTCARTSTGSLTCTWSRCVRREKSIYKIK